MSDNLKKSDAQGQKPTSLDNFWMETGQNAVKEAIGRQEEAAKQLISITSILQAIYFAAISFSNLKNALILQDLHGWLLVIFIALFVSPIALWLISLRFAVRVLVPIIRSTNLNSPTMIQEMYQDAIDYKTKHLQRAHWALVLGFLPLVVCIIVYLAWVQVPISLPPSTS